MSWKKKWNKAVKPLKAPAKKAWGVIQRYALGGVMPQFGGGEGDYRSEAAGQLVKKNVSTQAGAGKINYTQEVWE